MSCQRYETEGLTGFPPTPELRAHLATCAECQAAEGAYARLEKLLAVSSVQAAPPPGWEQRLDTRLAQGGRRFSLRSVALIASALAATLIAVLFFPRRTADEPLLATQSELIAATGRRAAGASVGSTWKVSVDLRQEVRVWKNQSTLVLRCGASASDGCEGNGERRAANVLLSAPGEYRAMVLTAGSKPLAEPVSFDEDARLAREKGARYDVLEPIVVY